MQQNVKEVMDAKLHPECVCGREMIWKLAHRGAWINDRGEGFFFIFLFFFVVIYFILFYFVSYFQQSKNTFQKKNKKQKTKNKQQRATIWFSRN